MAKKSLEFIELGDKERALFKEILDSLPNLPAQVRNMQLKEARRLLAINEARQDKGV